MLPNSTEPLPEITAAKDPRICQSPTLFIVERLTYSEMFLGVALLVVAPLELASFSLLNLS